MHQMQFNSTDLTVAVSTYMNAESLRRTMESVEANCYQILVIDGKYKGSPDNWPKYSTDQTVSVVNSFKRGKYVQLSAPQIEKRQYYFDHCKTPLLLLLDDDEYITGNWNTFFYNAGRAVEEGKNCYGISGDDHPHVFYKPQEMEYYEKHFLLKRKDAKGLPNQFQPTGQIHRYIEGIQYHTDDALMSKERRQFMRDYQKYNMKAEDVKGFYWENVCRLRSGQSLV